MFHAVNRRTCGMCVWTAHMSLIMQHKVPVLTGGIITGNLGTYGHVSIV